MIIIGNRKIGAGETPFVIAEMSGNHNQSLDRALEIVEAAAKTGARDFRATCGVRATDRMGYRKRPNPKGL